MGSIARLRNIFSLMASTSQGRGKSAFREFKRDIAATKRDITVTFRSGFTLSAQDIQNQYDLVFTNYVRMIEEADLPNPQIWINRGDAATAKSEDDVLDILGIGRKNNVISREEDSLSFEKEDKETGEFKRFSVPIINPTDRLAKAGIAMRKRLIQPEEIDEYVSVVPYLIGVEEVYEKGVLKGYRVWVQS